MPPPVWRGGSDTDVRVTALDLFGNDGTLCPARSTTACPLWDGGTVCQCKLQGDHEGSHTCARCGGEFLQKTETAHARRTDPDTSHEAAAAASVNIRRSQREVLTIFTRFGDMTDIDLVRRAGDLGSRQSTSGLRTRRSELVTQGRIERKRKVKLEGSNRTIWGLV